MSKLQCNRLQNNSICQQMYTDLVKSKYRSLEETKNSEWNTLREASGIGIQDYLKKEKQEKGGCH